MMPSILPNAEVLKARMQALAALDAIMTPDWEDRYFSFDANWAADQQMGSIRNGSGDDIYVLFKSEGCFLKGFAHEVSAPSLQPQDFYQTVPDCFQGAAVEPAFTPNDVSFCGWYLNAVEKWQSAIDEAALDKRAFFLLDYLVGQPQHYKAHADAYFDTNIDSEIVADMFRRTPLSEQTAEVLNPDVNFAELRVELGDIGFPVAG